jgi:hypothetical protein
MSIEHFKRLVKMGMAAEASTADIEDGIIGYCVKVFPCKTCGRPTNLYYKMPTGGVRLACSEKCAV